MQYPLNVFPTSSSILPTCIAIALTRPLASALVLGAVQPGQWHVINLLTAPFKLPPPVASIPETGDE
eukprot:576742-Rhodomonas_salina.1